MRTRIMFSALALAVLLLDAQGALAGTICGTVRDASTLLPISRAGVFVRLPAGAYTGHHAATDSTGFYCVENVPAGIYDLEYQVDHYVTAYVRNVVVEDDVTAVDVGARQASRLRAWPVPARTQLTIEIQPGGNGAGVLEAFDARGRFVKNWFVDGSARTFSWNLRDERGARVPAGVYFLRLRGGGTSTQTRITLLQ